MSINIIGAFAPRRGTDAAEPPPIAPGPRFREAPPQPKKPGQYLSDGPNT